MSHKNGETDTHIKFLNINREGKHTVHNILVTETELKLKTIYGT
jgi:hypothetical protein